MSCVGGLLLRSLLMVAILLAGPASAAPPYTADELRSEAEAEPFAWEVMPAVLAPGGAGRITLTLRVPAGTVVYRDQLEVHVVEPGELSFSPADFPVGRVQQDPAGTILREQYDRDVVVYLPVAAPADAGGGVPVTLRTRHQGCRGRLCYSPRETEHRLVVPVRADDVRAPPE